MEKLLWLVCQNPKRCPYKLEGKAAATATEHCNYTSPDSILHSGCSMQLDT